MRNLALLFIVFTASICFAQQEQITSFHTDIEVDTTSTIQITETIDIISSGNIFKRGIVRYLPKYKTDSAGKQLQLNYEIIHITKDGEKEKFHTKNTSDNLEIYVGESDKFIPNGAHEYQILYYASNAIGFYEKYDELYWNVNGFGWDFHIPKVSATVHFPGNSEIIQSACYTGSYGSSASDCSYEIKGNTVTFNAKNIYPQQNLTIAAGIQKGTLIPPPPPPPPSWFQKFGLLLIAALLTVFLSGYYYLTWKKHGVDPPKPIPHPQFSSPHNMSPASLGMIHKERYWSDLTTPALVNLAIKGFIKITETEENTFLGLSKKSIYTLTKTKDTDQSLASEEKILMSRLFDGRQSVSLDGTYKSYVKTAITDFADDLSNQHKPLINEGNNYKFLILPILLVIGFMILAVFIGAQTNNMHIFSFLFGGISFMPFLFFMLAFTRFFFKYRVKWIFIIIGFILLISIILYMSNLPINVENLNMFSVGGFLSFGLLSLAFYQYYIKRPSEEKLHLQSLIEGFKMYLGAAEEKQLQHFNPPQVTPEIFEKFLPYAIALGTDEVWGKKFHDFLRKSAIKPEEYTHGWYAGNNFNAMHLGSHLNSGLSNSMSSAGTPPSSSGSGSGGGGFSGGGGGGGGGGGW